MPFMEIVLTRGTSNDSNCSRDNNYCRAITGVIIEIIK